ncbi:alpha-tocopherol transfer protein isoform X2 [Fopius arisanus]|uniref:Alpha-tocopherol transfer protein isoform X2 n=1 Tax=Fopius arisanus TaxID=64838 RepID=A0A9R1U3S2_9HYME|nr:PREDICTED: alpha-tocopherol transfer protein isoform X2 [Fopius arisanus]
MLLLLALDKSHNCSLLEFLLFLIETSAQRSHFNDDFTIQRFLRVCKFDVERAKKKMYNYHAQRTASADWFANRDPLLPEMQNLFELGPFLPLKDVDDDGRIVVILRVCIHNPAQHSIANVIKAGLMILDLALKDHVSASVYGISAIFDMTGVSLDHALQMTPSVIKRLTHAWQGCYPLRIQSLNFVNAPVYVNLVINIFKSFMDEKLKSRTLVHKGSSKEFFETKVPQRLLPEEYGGSAGPLQNLINYWKSAVEENSPWLKSGEQYRLATP